LLIVWLTINDFIGEIVLGFKDTFDSSYVAIYNCKRAGRFSPLSNSFAKLLVKEFVKQFGLRTVKGKSRVNRV